MAAKMKMIGEKEFNQLSICDAKSHLLETEKYLKRFPGIRNAVKEFDAASKYLHRADFCNSMKRYVYSVYKNLVMKTKPKKKAVKKTVDEEIASLKPHLYELYRTRNGAWKFRKRAVNGKILNHSYNSRKLAIEGMKVDYELTKAMSEFGFKDLTK